MYDNDFYSRNYKFQLALSKELTPFLKKRLKIESIADFGCGCGKLTHDISQAFKITDVTGINGDVPHNLCIDKNRLTLWDFNSMIPKNYEFRSYDLVISLEVAEHINPGSADSFIHIIATAADEYILFSAATPGQGGIGHVNEQPHEYWHKKFLKYGWKPRDIIRPHLRGKKSVPFWYRNNIFLYERG